MNSESSSSSSSSLFGQGRGSGLKDFLNSSSLIARFSFLLVVIFLFILLLQIGVSMIAGVINMGKNSPHLIDGMIDGKQMLIVPQDPKSKGAITINRSKNGPAGIEFTWSVWVYINDLQYLSGQYRHIFHKGNNSFDSKTGLNQPNNAPGLYISPSSNELTIIMNTYDVINEQIVIPNIPMNKWMNVIIRCRNQNVDVYMNGTIAKSILLSGVPKQNYGNVYVAANGGFSGYVSNLWYYSHALGISTIQSIVKGGPNLKLVNPGGMDIVNPNYLSTRWFFAGTQDQFNP